MNLFTVVKQEFEEIKEMTPLQKKGYFLLKNFSEKVKDLLSNNVMVKVDLRKINKNHFVLNIESDKSVETLIQLNFKNTLYPDGELVKLFSGAEKRLLIESDLNVDWSQVSCTSYKYHNIKSLKVYENMESAEVEEFFEHSTVPQILKKYY